jgi:hypothetical protein
MIARSGPAYAEDAAKLVPDDGRGAGLSAIQAEKI